MRDWLGKLCSDPSGVPDEVRVAFLLTIVAYIAGWTYWLVTGHAWSALTFAGGIGAIVPAFGAGIAVRGGH